MVEPLISNDFKSHHTIDITLVRMEQGLQPYWHCFDCVRNVCVLNQGVYAYHRGFYELNRLVFSAL